MTSGVVAVVVVVVVIAEFSFNSSAVSFDDSAMVSVSFLGDVIGFGRVNKEAPVVCL